MPSTRHVLTWTPEERAAQHRKQLMATPLSDVPGLTVRVINIMEEEGVLLVSELLLKTAKQLLSMPNFGEKTLVEVRDSLKEFGLKPTWRLPKRKHKK